MANVVIRVNMKSSSVFSTKEISKLNKSLLESICETLTRKAMKAKGEVDSDAILKQAKVIAQRKMKSIVNSRSANQATQVIKTADSFYAWATDPAEVPYKVNRKEWLKMKVNERLEFRVKEVAQGIAGCADPAYTYEVVSD